jgi:hypothetical protein
VYPDAIWVDDPHSAPRLDREASRILWRTWPMTVRLPDLGPAFTIEPKNAGNAHRATTRDGSFPVRPGVYLLHRPGAAAATFPAPEFVAPPPSGRPPAVVHRPAVEAVEGQPLRITATIAASRPPDAVILHLRDAGPSLPMRHVSGYVYAATVPADRLHAGRLEYAITVSDGKNATAFPSRLPDTPSSAAAIVLYPQPPPRNPGGATAADFAPDKGGTGRALRLVGGTGTPNTTITIATPTDGLRADVPSDALLVRGRSLDRAGGSVTATLTTKDGARYTLGVPLTPEWSTQRVPLSALRPAKGWIVLRRPTAATLDSIEFSLRPGSDGAEIQTVALGPEREFWTTDLRPRGSAPVLFDAARDFRDLLTLVPFGRNTGGVSLTVGDAGRTALSVPAPPSSRGPAETAVRYVLDDRWSDRRPAFMGCDALRVRARATTDSVKSFSLALIDHDGIAWGTTVPLTTAWQEIPIPLRSQSPVRVPRVPISFPTALNEPTPLPAGRRKDVDLAQLEAIQFTLSATGGEATAGPSGIEIESVTLATE